MAFQSFCCCSVSTPKFVNHCRSRANKNAAGTGIQVTGERSVSSSLASSVSASCKGLSGLKLTLAGSRGSGLGWWELGVSSCAWDCRT